jgi:hypothetical protein
MTQVYLMPVTAATQQIELFYPDNILYSKHIAFREFASIVAVTKPNDNVLFGISYLTSVFNINVWVSLIITLILLSLIMEIIQNRANKKLFYKHFLLRFWNLSAVLLSEKYPKMEKRFSMRVIIGSWLSNISRAFGNCGRYF